MKKITLLLAFVACALVSQAQTLLTEDFDYTIGSGIKAAGWATHSGGSGTNDSILVTTGLTFDGYPGSGIGGAAAVNSFSKDMNKTFTAQTSGTTYAAFMFKSLGAGAGNVASYFIHLAPSVTGNTFFTRIWVNATGDGLGLGDTAPTSYQSVTANTTYLVVVKYDFASKTNSLNIFSSMPTTEPTTAQVSFNEIKGPAATTPTNIGSICLRQGATYANNVASANQNVVVDGIRVATSWAALFSTAGISTPSASALDVKLVGKTLTVSNALNAVEIYNTVGAKVQTLQLVNGSAELSLAKGLYIVRAGNQSAKIRL